MITTFYLSDLLVYLSLLYLTFYSLFFTADFLALHLTLRKDMKSFETSRKAGMLKKIHSIPSQRQQFRPMLPDAYDSQMSASQSSIRNGMQSLADVRIITFI